MALKHIVLWVATAALARDEKTLKIKGCAMGKAF